MNEKHSHETDILKNKHEILEMKNSIHQIKMQWKSLTDILRQKNLI